MTDQQPRLFQIWLDASDGSIATYDGVQWPDGTADVHHRYRRPDGVQWSPERLAETIHGKQARVEWTPDAAAGLRERAERAEAQVARVRGVHRVSTMHDAVPGRAPYCENCRFTWPCPTIQALEQP